MNIGFIIGTPIISNVKSLILEMSRLEIFNLYICFEMFIKSKSLNIIENDFNDIDNLKILEPSDFSKLKNAYIFSNTPYLVCYKKININKLLQNNKFLNVNYAYHIHKQLYYITYDIKHFKHFYASFHECPENYEDFISYIIKINKNFDISTAHISGSTKIQYLKNYDNVKKNIKIFNNENKTILFSFRWEKISNNYNGNLYTDYFLNYIKINSNLNFIYRPHPNSNEKKLINFQNHNYYIDYENDHKNTFDNSDIMISDLSTLISDFFIYTKKPIILMKSKNSLEDILNSFGKKIIQGIYVINNEDELNNYLTLLLNNVDEKKDLREQIANELDIYDANNYIIEFIKNDYYKNNSLDNLNNQYWNNFYKNYKTNEINKPSTFAEFVLEYLKKNNLINSNNKLLEFGCGNGRDLMLFKEYLNVVGLDTSIQVKDLLKEKNINVIIESMTLFSDYNYDLYYSRFSLHAMNINEINIFLSNIKNIKPNALFFIETRSIKGTNFENNDYCEHNFKSPIGDSHKRTLLNILYLKNIIVDSFEIIYEADINDVAIYKEENPYVIRLILKKK